MCPFFVFRGKERKMCKHSFVKINDVKVCRKCGLTAAEGRLFYDKEFKKTLERNARRKKK